MAARSWSSPHGTGGGDDGRAIFTKVGPGIAEDLDRLIASFEKGPPIIQGSLVVTGHSYWVILEYGSSPATPDAGPGEDDPVGLQVPWNAPQMSKHHGEWYVIAPRRRKRLFFNGGFHKVVSHPGNTPRAFLRRIIWKWQEQLYRELQTVGYMLDRDELVQIVNVTLLTILAQVHDATPLGKPDKYIAMPDDVGHLRDAWSVDLAR
jgi:hypothetical protein